MSFWWYCKFNHCIHYLNRFLYQIWLFAGSHFHSIFHSQFYWSNSKITKFNVNLVAITYIIGKTLCFRHTSCFHLFIKFHWRWHETLDTLEHLNVLIIIIKMAFNQKTKKCLKMKVFVDKITAILITWIEIEFEMVIIVVRNGIHYYSNRCVHNNPNICIFIGHSGWPIDQKLQDISQQKFI